MEAIMQRSVATALRSALIAMLVANLPVHAGTPDSGEDIPKGMQRYVIPMKGCAVGFVAKAGGFARATPSDESWGTFRHENYFPKRKDLSSLSFTLSCHAGSARELCPRLMAAFQHLDKDEARDFQFRHLDNLNSRYYTEAYITTGIAPPRRRELALCMGDGTHVVKTQAAFILGYEPREFAETQGKPVSRQSEYALPDVLAIIRSMRLLSDAADGATSPQR